MPNHSRRKPEASTESDAELWKKFTSGIKPLPRPREERHQKPVAAPPPPRPPLVPAERPTAPPPPLARPPAALQQPPALSPGSAAGLDQRTLIRLKRGLLRPETQIDLHWMTQGEAHAALGQFLAAAQQAGRRCVLVITGKGYRSDGAVGVLKANVPRWLNEPPNRERILAFAFAASRDGGEGALYVLLRRLRSSEPPASNATTHRR